MGKDTPSSDDLGRRRNAERRQYIRENHPDRGGDSDAFIAGLRKRSSSPAQSEPSLAFYRRPRGLRRIRLFATTLVHRTIRRPKPQPRVR